MRKVLVFVYRHADGCDCTNNGITSKHTELWLFDGDKEECITYAKENGIADKSLWLNRRILWNEKHYFAEPLIEPDICGPHMMGGNFVYSCDGAFSALCGDHPLPVHDRYETWEQYDALSR